MPNRQLVAEVASGKHCHDADLDWSSVTAAAGAGEDEDRCPLLQCKDFALFGAREPHGDVLVDVVESVAERREQRGRAAWDLSRIGEPRAASDGGGVVGVDEFDRLAVEEDQPASHDDRVGWRAAERGGDLWRRLHFSDVDELLGADVAVVGCFLGPCFRFARLARLHVGRGDADPRF